MSDRDYRATSKPSRELLTTLDGMTWPDLLEELGPPDSTTSVSRQGGRR
jgi:hypothetical protein